MLTKTTTSKNLEYLLKIGGWKQRFIANKLKVSEDTVSSWISGRYYPQPSRIQQLCDFFNNRLKNDFGEITPERLKNENLEDFQRRHEIHFRLDSAEIMEPSPRYEEKPDQLTQGMREFLDDKKTLDLMKVTEEEIKVLKGIQFRDHRFQPSKQFYIDALFDYRKSKKEEGS